ncbi:MAG: bifunctional DNA-formamidopyrimidine glycosylase/DNA-(apurinic or apyrimidinic site) lyase [Bacillota bacterium]|nr:MAG: bifunctional DNA-formamidopyrimidine glycosylase/DNA-(apurinic or apyrimidinic site) lyase [Bacillota bacterium]
MPELPEVETIRRVLAVHLPGRVIAGVQCRRADVVAGPSPEDLARLLAGGRFVRVGRRGKYLLLWVERDGGLVQPVEGAGPVSSDSAFAARAAGGASPVAGGSPASREGNGTHPSLLVGVHLRMTGRLTLARRGEPLPPHTHVVIQLVPVGPPGDPWDELRFSDTRRFGRFYLMDPRAAAGVVAAAEWGDDPPPLPRGSVAGAAGGSGAMVPPAGLLQLGPEPLGPQFGPGALARRLAGRRAPVKAVLLDQRVVAGLGNIYADEALFRARIDPRRAAGSLAPGEVARLVRSIRAVLRDALAAGGTTFSDYRDGLGREGAFAPRLAVYGRAGRPCRRCGTPIATTRLAGRTTHFCPSCQGA